MSISLPALIIAIIDVIVVLALLRFFWKKTLTDKRRVYLAIFVIILVILSILLGFVGALFFPKLFY